MAERVHNHKKRKFGLGRQPANTKLGAKRIHSVRVRGRNIKCRAIRLDSGNHSWGSEAVRLESSRSSAMLRTMNWLGWGHHACEGSHCTSRRDIFQAIVYATASKKRGKKRGTGVE